MTSPIDLSRATMKEAEAEWLVEAFDYIQNRPSIINGFMESGIIRMLLENYSHV